jgi:predicted dehydrogenase
VREAVTTLCGTKAGADMTAEGSLLINGVKNGRQYVTVPDLKAGGVAFYEGGSVKPEDLEAQTFANAIKGKGKLYVLPEQAAVVTRILEGIYISASTGTVYNFE